MRGIPKEKSTHSITEAKQRFRATMDRFDPLAGVKATPLTSVGVAFLIGLGWSVLWRTRVIPNLVPLTTELLKSLRDQRQT